MANPVFPEVPAGTDSSKYRVELEDVALKTDLEGGYVASRPRHTRTPRRTFTSGYTKIPDAEKQQIEAFYNQVHGGSLIFDWKNPEDQVIYQVRFADRIEFQYEGIGFTKLWTFSVRLQQA